jgi:hypothetical protein
MIRLTPGGGGGYAIWNGSSRTNGVGRALAPPR